ncbi:MAG: multiheme c-type cytochrome [Xanthomonadales bacterium]|nr:multiheme c-type cytochrome [Xanthomonadales bacterium]
MRRLDVVFGVFFVSGLVQAQTALPIEGKDKHLGVASCASSTCHGSTSAFADSNVMQNEFALWQSQDPHAEAYQILLNDQSKRIARNLGLKSAHEADMCLDCHGDNVPASARGEKFDMADGVGCEACHGGSERYLSSHASGQASHADNLAAGLYATEDPARRAELCLSCHLGNKNQMITHRIMGAGHPRLSFELDTFTWLYPHFEVDEDYVQRKGEPNGARDWAVGQGVSASTQLETLLDDSAGWDGIFPELVLFDCHACHRSMFGNQWVPRRGTGLGPGVVRYNDASLLMFRHVLAAIDGAAGEKLAGQVRDLHVSTTRGRNETVQAARAVMATLQSAIARANAAEFDRGMLEKIMASILADGERGQYRDYAAAEQASMAVDAVILAFENNGVLSADEAEGMRSRAEGLFEATKDEDGYRQSRFVEALNRLKMSAP